MRPAADIWLNHPNRRQYIGGIVFHPSGRPCQPDEYNLWTGFAVTPKKGTWDRMLRHIHSIVANGDQTVASTSSIGWHEWCSAQTSRVRPQS